MNHHENARLTFEGRRILVSRITHEGLPVREAAKAQGVSPRTAYKWLRRFREEGEAGLYDRSSRPYRSPRRTHEDIRRRAVELRRQRWPYHAPFSYTPAITQPPIGLNYVSPNKNTLRICIVVSPTQRSIRCATVVDI